MPIAFAPWVGLALGAAFAWVAAPELARDDTPVALSRSFALVLAFAGLLWLPIVGYFVAFHGDWSYLYLIPWRRVPSAIDLLLVVAAGLTVTAGFWLSVRPVRSRRLGPVVALVLGPGLLAAVGLAVAARRLGISATYAQFHGDFGTEPIAASTLGRGVLTMDILLVLGVAWTVRALMSREPHTPS